MVIPATQEGYDRSYLTDTTLTGIYVLAEQVVKRITVDSGNMFWDTNTDNAESYLMAKMGPADVAQLQTYTNSLFANDPRMTVNTIVTYQQRILTYTITIVPTSDPTPIVVTYQPETNTLRVSR